MKLLFAQAYHLKFDPKLWAAMQPYPPLATLIAAAIARRAGHHVRLVDSLFCDTDNAWNAALQKQQPDMVVLYEDNFNYLSKMCLLNMRDAAARMTAQAKSYGAQVIVCSSDATDHPELYFAQGADFILLGEGDATLEELLRALRREPSSHLNDILGLAWKDRQGKIVKNKSRPVICDLDTLPGPAWDLLDFEAYRAIWRRHHGYYSINLVTSRGCPYQCNWCAKPLWGRHYNAHSPEQVVNEMLHLQNTVKPDHIWFMDDIFGLKPGWLSEFAQLLQRENLKIPFKCLSRPDLLQRNGDIEALALAGCRQVWIGAESGSQKILTAMTKQTSVSDIRCASEKLKNAGIEVGHFIQFGYLGETWRDIMLTLKMLRSVKPDYLGISVSYPLPGTLFHDRVKEQLGQKQNWRHSDDLAMLYQSPFGTKFYRCLHKLTHADLYVRKCCTWRDWAGRWRAPVHFIRHLAGLFYNVALLSLLWPQLWLLRFQSQTDGNWPGTSKSSAQAPDPLRERE